MWLRAPCFPHRTMETFLVPKPRALPVASIGEASAQTAPYSNLFNLSVFLFMGGFSVALEVIVANSPR